MGEINQMINYNSALRFGMLEDRISINPAVSFRIPLVYIAQ
jgi:hypothetical protein